MLWSAHSAGCTPSEWEGKKLPDENSIKTFSDFFFFLISTRHSLN